MKILAFNSSPRKETGATDIVLNKFLDGARETGAEIEKIYLKDKEINQCIGCYSCWTKTPGICIYKDDMPDVLNKIIKADIIVFGTPLYHVNISSSMKILLERTLPLSKPFLVKNKKSTNHPRRFKEYHARWVIISVCGFPEIEHFQALDMSFQQLAKLDNTEIIGKIYRPSSEMLRNKSAQKMFKKYLDNCYLAGKEVVENGKITEKTQKELYKDFVIPKFLFRFMANRFWKKSMEG